MQEMGEYIYPPIVTVPSIYKSPLTSTPVTKKRRTLHQDTSMASALGASPFQSRASSERGTPEHSLEIEELRAKLEHERRVRQSMETQFQQQLAHVQQQQQNLQLMTGGGYGSPMVDVYPYYTQQQQQHTMHVGLSSSIEHHHDSVKLGHHAGSEEDILDADEVRRMVNSFGHMDLDDANSFTQFRYQ